MGTPDGVRSDAYRKEYGIEPICIELPITPSTIYEHQACKNDTATRPNQMRVADLTYVPTWRGFVYVAFIIDGFYKIEVIRRRGPLRNLNAVDYSTIE